MYTLGIETSCDETSCSVVRGRKVLSNSTVSSLPFHKKYGGVIPEIATRNHIKFIDIVTHDACRKARIDLNAVGLISVTSHPGLMGALVVGLNFAKGLACALNRPFLGINHLHAHLFAPFLNTTGKFPLPFLGLVVSGGHTQLFLVKDFDRIITVGKTRDDAAGEVFDKVARAFGLGYPGGAAIDKIFRHSHRNRFAFKCGIIGFDFSFSGIKTALIYKKMELEKKGVFSRETKVSLLSSFQESVVSAIVDNTMRAAKKYNIKDLACGGGVIANHRLRQVLTDRAAKEKVSLHLAPFEFASDNAAMVAGLGFYLYNRKKKESPLSLEAASN